MGIGGRAVLDRAAEHIGIVRKRPTPVRVARKSEAIASLFLVRTHFSIVAVSLLAYIGGVVSHIGHADQNIILRTKMVLPGGEGIFLDTSVPYSSPVVPFVLFEEEDN